MKHVILAILICFLWLELLVAVQNRDKILEALIAYNGPTAESSRHKFYELSSEQYFSGEPEVDYGTVIVERKKRLSDPTFRGKPKTREQVWAKNFAHIITNEYQAKSLVKLLIKVVTKYLHACIPLILFDGFVEQTESYIMEALFTEFPMTYTCGKIGPNYTLDNPDLLRSASSKCRSYILFISDVMMTRQVIGPQLTDYVIVIPRSRQWKLQDFLRSKDSRDILNLLVIGESYSVLKANKGDVPYVLYTHELYTDGLGSSRPIVLTSWMNGRFSRVNVDLFPKKMKKGFSGHRFTIAAGHQPPFVFKILSTDGVGNINIRWDGLEIRILQTLSNYLNFTYDIKEPAMSQQGLGDAVTNEISRHRADIGLAGAYVTIERNVGTEMSVAHSTDCAAFATLMSSSLPRYRAILGPFQWPVWVALTLIYLLAIFPLAFSDKLSLRHLIGNWSEIENMFWYVYGTFTNSLTFTGENSWSNTQKTSTRMLIGVYWVFTIIITACYTGSIIAFVTMPVLPDTVDTVAQLRNGFYRVGTLDRGGWERWFLNSSDPATEKLLKKLEFVSSVQEGIKNITGAFFISYAFIGSKAELNYLVQSNFSKESTNMRYQLHVSKECFVLFSVSYVFPINSIYRDKFNNAILYMQEAGIVSKLRKDVSWSLQKTKDGRYRQASVGETLRTPTTTAEKGLTLADTEGMFLLMGVGYLIGAGVLISEWVGGCTNKCREIIRSRRERPDSFVSSNTSSANPNSPRRRRRPSGKEYNLTENIDSSSTLPITPRPADDDSGSDVSERTRHQRSLSESFHEFNQNTLHDLYDGPNRRHSTIVCVDGKAMSEEEARRYASRKHKHSSSLSSVVEHEVTRLFKYLDDHKSTHEDLSEQSGKQSTKKAIEVAVEVNRSVGGVSKVVIDSVEESIDVPFGEKVLY
ncbi:ionotropic receptor 21a [Toxorhynchites rutilus septentrionalis]|uniref:ionotropic receptor 21a n=1 Tax=Toxorhynchites rutilus septentrionalis TaxID=329112 RepID=UPI00247870FF|nr:ionotropic receptor 21a [Toxorhynchites rutilus septentrionalis]